MSAADARSTEVLVMLADPNAGLRMPISTVFRKLPGSHSVYAQMHNEEGQEMTSLSVQRTGTSSRMGFMKNDLDS
ncbi:VPS10 domain-containing receptor SorCS2 isoform X2 [Lates japonicus]|uniref:VPS10 domain-containing receptor SorCS2 isoform X2 n=1 Tax=Lates japonicus TaxID=270547 RepID=A0AAD3M4Y1_LATJO|nr:VPS10 domain-containing receptor SorCS2 isoform X2 [Lates japonicus]